MAQYTQYSQEWLEDPESIKIILVVTQVYNVTNTLTETLNWSNAAYTTTEGIYSFSALIRRDVRLVETLSPDGTGAMTFGDLELDNPNGELDQYLDSAKYIWSNRPIQIYYGDPQWNCNFADVFTRFQLVFNGVIDNVDSRARNTLNLKVRDKLEQLNTPLTEDKLGVTGTWNGGQQNQDAIKPVIFGEAFNITPLLTDPSSLKYQFNNGVSEALLEIRDNGNPIYNSSLTGATVNLTTSTFTLPYQALGTLTCSVQGIKSPVNLTTQSITSTPTYTDNIAVLIATIVTQYGRGVSGTRPSARFTVADLDFANLRAFSSANTQSVCAVITDTQNVLTVCRSLANSIGAQLFITRAGKLQLLRYGVPYNSSPVVTEIAEQDIIYNSIMVSRRSDVVAAVKLGFGKNYTTQTGLLTSIPQNHKDNFAEPWITNTQTNQTVASQYKLTLEAQQTDTQLVNTAQAIAECTRRLNYDSVQHTVYKFTGTSKLLGLVLGQSVVLKHSRFNLYNSGNGTTGQVITLSPNWTSGSVEVEVLI